MSRSIATFAMIFALVFALSGCAVVPASYAPTTGKVGAQTGESCVFIFLGLIPFGSRIDMLGNAADNAGNPTKDVAVINKSTWWVIGTNQCVVVKGTS